MMVIRTKKSYIILQAAATTNAAMEAAAPATWAVVFTHFIKTTFE